MFDLVDGFGRLWMDGRRADSQSLGVGKVFVDVALCNLLCAHTFLVCLFDDFVIDVGEVLDKGDLIATELQIAAQGIKDTNRTCVADVDKVVDGRSTGIHLDLARLDWHKFFFFSCQRIKYFHGNLSFL